MSDFDPILNAGNIEVTKLNIKTNRWWDINWIKNMHTHKNFYFSKELCIKFVLFLTHFSVLYWFVYFSVLYWFVWLHLFPESRTFSSLPHFDANTIQYFYTLNRLTCRVWLSSSISSHMKQNIDRQNASVVRQVCCFNHRRTSPSTTWRRLSRLRKSQRRLSFVDISLYPRWRPTLQTVPTDTENSLMQQFLHNNVGRQRGWAASERRALSIRMTNYQYKKAILTVFKHIILVFSTKFWLFKCSTPNCQFWDKLLSKWN